MNYFETKPRTDALPSMTDPHISQHDLERYHLGMVGEESELAPLEEHILACYHCARRAEEIADYVDAMRAAACTLDETAGPKD
jgi:hypothetical protein